MASFGDAMKTILKTVAPLAASALPGPLGNTVSVLVAKALGKEGASDQEIEEAVLKADPETMLKLKTVETDFKKFLKDAEIKEQALENEDRGNARDREKVLRDRTPAILAAVVTLGFFGVLGFMLHWGLPSHGEQALLVMLGALGTAWGSIINYYYGSSSSSRTKDATISAALQGK